MNRTFARPAGLVFLFALAFAAAVTCAGADSRTATLDGAKIHSTVTGKGPNTVILVHGWTCDETSWSDQVPAFSEEYRVVTLDLPGHGQSDPPKDGKFSMDLFARAIDAVRADVHAERVVLVGHSMGTTVIIRYAELYPQHTVGMVFVDGVTAGNPQRAKRSPSMMGGADGMKNRETMIRGFFSSSTTPAMQKKILHMMLAAPESTAVGAMEATDDATAKPGGIINVPVLAIYADPSRLAAPDYLHAHFPHSQYTQIPNTGHFLMMEKPAEFNRMVMAFLAKQKF